MFTGVEKRGEEVPLSDLTQAEMEARYREQRQKTIGRSSRGSLETVGTGRRAAQIEQENLKKAIQKARPGEQVVFKNVPDAHKKETGANVRNPLMMAIESSSDEEDEEEESDPAAGVGLALMDEGVRIAAGQPPESDPTNIVGVNSMQKLLDDGTITISFDWGRLEVQGALKYKGERPFPYLRQLPKQSIFYCFPGRVYHTLVELPCFSPTDLHLINRVYKFLPANTEVLVVDPVSELEDANGRLRVISVYDQKKLFTKVANILVDGEPYIIPIVIFDAEDRVECLLADGGRFAFSDKRINRALKGFNPYPTSLHGDIVEISSLRKLFSFFDLLYKVLENYNSFAGGWVRGAIIEMQIFHLERFIKELSSLSNTDPGLASKLSSLIKILQEILQEMLEKFQAEMSSFADEGIQRISNTDHTDDLDPLSQLANRAKAEVTELQLKTDKDIDEIFNAHRPFFYRTLEQEDYDYTRGDMVKFSQ